MRFNDVSIFRSTELEIITSEILRVLVNIITAEKFTSPFNLKYKLVVATDGFDFTLDLISQVQYKWSLIL